MKNKHTSDISYKKRQKITHGTYFSCANVKVRILNLRVISGKKFLFFGKF